MAMAAEGAYGKALQTLGSSGIHSDSPEVRASLLAKHPQSIPDSEGTSDFEPAAERHANSRQHIAPFEPFTPYEIGVRIRKFRRGSAGGGSGLTPTHLRELITHLDAHDEEGLLDYFAKLCTHLDTCEAPQNMAKWIVGAPLTPLKKDDNGVRPIAGGETICRLVSVAVLARHKSDAQRLLRPLQFGVARRNGTELVVHATREWVAQMGHDNRYASLQVDLQNAFNIVSRRAMLREVRRHVPQMLSWVQFCYGEEVHRRVWTSTFTFDSKTGVHQGDPLAPFLFALVLRPVLIQVRAVMGRAQHEDELIETGTIRKLDDDFLLAFYLDDGVLVGTHRALIHALEFLQSQKVRNYGLHIRVDKTRRWWPVDCPQNIAEEYPTELTVLREEDVSFLKSPIGTHRFMRAEMNRYALDKTRKIERVMELNDAHNSFSLLRTCFGVSQMNHHLRAVPPTATITAAQIDDDSMQEAMRDLAGGVLTEAMYDELTLPIRIDDARYPDFGAG